MNDTPIPWESVSPELEPGLEDRIRRQLDAERQSAKQPAIKPIRQSKSKPDDELGAPSPKTYSKRFKYEVTLEAIRGILTQREISIRYQVPQPLVSRWKNLGLEAVEEVISSNRRRKYPTIKPGSAPLVFPPAMYDQASLMDLCETMRNAIALLEDLMKRSGVQTPFAAEEE